MEKAKTYVDCEKKQANWKSHFKNFEFQPKLKLQSTKFCVQKTKEVRHLHKPADPLLHLNNTSTILNYSSIPLQSNPLLELTQAKVGAQTVRSPQHAIKNPRKCRNPRKSEGSKNKQNNLKMPKVNKRVSEINKPSTGKTKSINSKSFKNEKVKPITHSIFGGEILIPLLAKSTLGLDKGKTGTIAKLRKKILSKRMKNQVKECKRTQPETVNQSLTNTTPFVELNNVVNPMNEKLTEKEVKKMFYLAMDGVMRQGSRLTRSSFYKHIWHLPEDCKEEYLPVRVQGHGV